MVITKTIKTDLINQKKLPKVDVMQNDACTRALAFRLFCNDEAWRIPDGVTAAVSYRKPDGTVGLYDTMPDGSPAVTLTDNVATAVLAAQALTVAGSVMLSVVLQDGKGKRLETFDVELIVHEDPAAGKTESDNYINLCAYVPQPAEGADRGQYLMVEAVNEQGWITGTRAVPLPGGGVTIDDKLVGDLAWSGKKIADTLAPAFAVNGPVVACDPVEGYPLKVVSQVMPVQSGSGDPSPDNIRPITGWTGAKLRRCGKNLIPFPYSDGYSKVHNGITFTVNDDGSVTATGTATDAASFKLYDNDKGLKAIDTPAGAQLFLSGCPVGGSVGTYSLFLGWIGTHETGEGYDLKNMLTKYPDAWSRSIAIQIASGVTVNDLTFYPQIEAGSAATAYEPYRGEEVVLDFGETVYGGTLDWNTGVLTVTRKLLAFNGAERWYLYLSDSVITSAYYLDIPDKLIGRGTSFCNQFKNTKNNHAFDSAYMAEGLYTDHPTLRNVYFDWGEPVDRSDTAAQNAALSAFKAWLKEQYDAGTPVEVCYELAQPVTIQLTPQQILALSGQNTLFTDTGDTQVSGRADPNAVIADIYAKLSALQTAAVNNI